MPVRPKLFDEALIGDTSPSVLQSLLIVRQEIGAQLCDKPVARGTIRISLEIVDMGDRAAMILERKVVEKIHDHTVAIGCRLRILHDKLNEFLPYLRRAKSFRPEQVRNLMRNEISLLDLHGVEPLTRLAEHRLALIIP